MSPEQLPEHSDSPVAIRGTYEAKRARLRDAADVVEEAASDLSYMGTEDQVEDFLAVARQLRELAARWSRI